MPDIPASNGDMNYYGDQPLPSYPDLDSITSGSDYQDQGQLPVNNDDGISIGSGDEFSQLNPAAGGSYDVYNLGNDGNVNDNSEDHLDIDYEGFISEEDKVDLYRDPFGDSDAPPENRNLDDDVILDNHNVSADPNSGSYNAGNAYDNGQTYDETSDSDSDNSFNAVDANNHEYADIENEGNAHYDGNSDDFDSVGVQPDQDAVQDTDNGNENNDNNDQGSAANAYDSNNYDYTGNNAVAKGQTEACNKKTTYVVIRQYKVIQSPNYPGNYPPNLNCTFRISTVRNDERVRIVFTSLNVDSRGDSMVLYDGKTVLESRKMIGPLDKVSVGNDHSLTPIGIMRPFFSSSKHLTIQMSTDSTFEASGFQISATAVKKGHTCTYEYPLVYLRLSDHDTHFPHTSRYSYLESPNFGGRGRYLSDINCIWNVTAMPHQRIRLKFLSPVSLTENKDYLKIFNGEEVVDNYTGYIRFPRQIESVGNYMYIELDSSHYGQREGFLAQVSVIVPDNYETVKAT